MLRIHGREAYGGALLKLRGETLRRFESCWIRQYFCPLDRLKKGL